MENRGKPGNGGGGGGGGGGVWYIHSSCHGQIEAAISSNESATAFSVLIIMCA